MWTMRTVALAAAVLLVAQPDTSPRLAAEIDRTRTAVSTSVPEPQRAGPLARLDRASKAVGAGRPFLALYLLESPWEMSRAFAIGEKASDEATSLDAFDRLWNRMGEPRALPPDRTPRPAIVEAIVEAALARGPVTFRASRAYAQDSGVEAGLYYLGESRAVGEFAAFARGLAWPDETLRRPAPAFRSIAGEIEALDSDVEAAYQHMERANHPTYISISALMKQARALDAAGSRRGALLDYLIARYLFAQLRPDSPADPDATVAALAAARASLERTRDHSIAGLFLDLGEENARAADAAVRRSAAAVASDVLPAYFRAIGPPQSTEAAASATPAVTITLVRWPFT